MIMEIQDYEKEVALIRKQNEEYLETFNSALQEEGLSQKTISKHLRNVDFYINEYLCYYIPQTMEMGCYCIDSFLGDWFARKALWSTRTTVNENCASIKKFYNVMMKSGNIADDVYDQLIVTIKEERENWLEYIDAYNNEEYID